MKKFFVWLLVFTILITSNSNLVMLVRANEEATPSADIEISPTPSATPTMIPDKEFIETNKEYIFDEGKVKLIFKKIDNPGELNIQKVDYQGNPAYDISSDMQNGSFIYDLYFLRTDTSKKQVKYSEDGEQFNKLESEENGDYIIVRDLDHFTIFVVTSPDPINNNCSNATFTVSVGDTCFNTIQAAVDAASSSAVISIKNGIYLENLILNKSGISLIGESRDGVIIKNPVPGSNTIGMTVQANGITVKKLTVKEFADGISLSDIDGFTLDGNLISDNSYSIPSGIHILDSKNVIINNNEFKNNSVAIDLSETTPGIVTNTILTNNIFSGNTTNLTNNVQSDILDATTNNWGSSDINIIENGIVHGCSADRYLHGTCNIEDLSSEFGSIKYANIGSPSFTVPVCSSLTNQSAVAPAWNNVPGANVSYIVERTSPAGGIVLDSSAFNMNIDGIWKWRIKAKAGSQESSYSSYCQVTYDGTAPTQPGSPGTLSPTKALVQSWFWSSSSDSLSGLKNYSWNVTGGTSGTTTGNSLTTFLTQGTWVFNVSANDNAGNKSATSSGTLVVDTSKPNGTITLSSSQLYDGGLTQQVTVTYDEPMASTPKPTITIGATTGVFISDVGTWISDRVWRKTYTLSDANETRSNVSVSVSGAYDLASNQQNTIPSKTFNIDTANPTLSSISISPSKSKVGTNIIINFSSSETLFTPVVTILGNSASVSGSITSWTANYSATGIESDGLVAFNISYQDIAGNSGVNVSSTTNGSSSLYDKTIPFISANNASTIWNSMSPSITLSVLDTGSLLAIAKYSWDVLASATIGTNFTNGQIIFIPNEGNHTLYLYAEDNVGNSNTWSGTYKLDISKPTGSWVSPTNDATISGTVNLTFNSNDNLSGVSSIVYKFAPDGSSNFIVIPSNNWDTTPLALGKYVLRATITDIAGNVSDVDETVYVAAVITSFSHRTIATDKIQIDWTTDRPTDGRVVYDRQSRFSIGEYAFSTGTVDASPNYRTSHSIVIGGLASGTYYHYRAVSAGTPVVLSIEESDRTFSEAVPPSNSSSDSSVFSTPIPVVILEQVAGVETEIVDDPSPTLTPVPQVEGVSTDVPILPAFNWWLLVVPALILFFSFLLWLVRRLRS